MTHRGKRHLKKEKYSDPTKNHGKCSVLTIPQNPEKNLVYLVYSSTPYMSMGRNTSLIRKPRINYLTAMVLS